MKLQHWRVSEDYSDRPCLIGYVFGSARFQDGEQIRTTPLEVLYGDTAQTLNSIYTLGDADPSWVKMLAADGRSTSEFFKRYVK